MTPVKNKIPSSIFKTKKISEAQRLGKELWIEVLGKVEASQPIFSPTTSQLVNMFLEVKKSEVGINKTYPRYQILKTQLGWYLEFVGADEKITDVDRNIWDGYCRFRRTHKPDVTDMTLSNDKSTIRNIYRLAVHLVYLPQRFLPQFPPISAEPVKRRALTVEEWKTIYEHMIGKKWTNVKSPKIVEQKKFVY